MSLSAAAGRARQLQQLNDMRAAPQPGLKGVPDPVTFAAKTSPRLLIYRNALTAYALHCQALAARTRAVGP